MNSAAKGRGPRRRELHAYVRERSLGLCEWPACIGNGEEMAHIRGIGMGGRASADKKSNVLYLCRKHHDILDGRRRPDVVAFTTLGITVIPVADLEDPAGLRRLMADALIEHVKTLRSYEHDD